MIKVLVIILLSFVYCDLNTFLLIDLYDQRTNWETYDLIDGKKIYTGKGINDDIMYIKINQQVDIEKEDLFKVLRDIELYNEIVSNKNIFSDLVMTKSDTIYGHQLITNVIPFIRNRQYIFKMYNYDDKRLDWILLDAENSLMKGYLGKNAHNLYYGAGSWSLNEDNVLSYRMFIDDEVSMPDRFMQKMRIYSAVDIFNDILNYLNNKED